jgi:hypothetical protein
MNETTSQGKLLYGSRAIARYLGNEKLAWKIRRHRGELPLFLFGDTLCAYTETLDAAIAEKQRAGLVPLKPVTRKHPSRPITA